MPFERPSLSKLKARIYADLQSRLPEVQLRYSDAAVYSTVIAGVAHSLYGYVDYLARQLFTATAEGEYLDRMGSEFDLLRKPASVATGKVSVTFSGEPVEVPLGSILQTTDGIQYETTTAVDDGVMTIRALVPGVDGNILEGETLTFVSPIAGVNSQVTSKGIAGGAESESDEDYRARILIRKRQKPSAGTAEDYVAWALEVPGVTRAWCFPREGGDGKVVIRVVCDGEDNIVPTNSFLEQVQAHIDSVRPITAHAFVYGPTITKVNFVFSEIEPDNETVKARVREALVSLFKREAEPGKRIYLSHIKAAISSAAGEENHVLLSPNADVVPATGALLMVGDITWP